MEDSEPPSLSKDVCPDSRSPAVSGTGSSSGGGSGGGGRSAEKKNTFILGKIRKNVNNLQ